MQLRGWALEELRWQPVQLVQLGSWEGYSHRLEHLHQAP